MTHQTATQQPSSTLLKRLAHLAIPIFIETLLIMMLGAVDTIMLSRHSDASVAAVGVVNQIIMLCFLVFEVINLGTSVLCSQYIGAKRYDRMRIVVGIALLFNLIIGVSISVFLYLGNDIILSAMGLDGEMMKEGSIYMRIVGAFAFCQAISLTISATLRAADHAIYPMIVSAIVNVINIFGNYVLIFGEFGMPALGTEGAAISTVVSRGIAMLLLLFFLFKTTIHKFPISIFHHFPYKELRNLLHIGLPSAGEQISYSSSQMVITYFINMLGMEALATRTYCVNIVMFSYLFCISISQGGAILIGHLVGSQHTKGAYLMGKIVMRLAIAITLTLSLIIAGFGPLIFNWLTHNPEIITLGTTILLIDIPLEFGRAINIFAVNALRATGDVNFPFIVGVVVMWSVAVIGAYIVGIPFALGICGMWAMFAIDENIRGYIFTRRWHSLKWAGKTFINK